MQQLGIFSGLVSTASSSINSPWLTALSASMAETNQSIGLEGGAVEGGGRKGGEGERERLFLHMANLLDKPYFFPSPYSASL